MAAAEKQLLCVGGHGRPSPSASPWEEFCGSYRLKVESAIT